MVQGLVLVHDMEEKRKDLLREEASRFGASDAPLTMDAHQYVALAHGPDVEEAVGEEEESNSSSCWIRRSFVPGVHEKSSVATEVSYSSSHLRKFGMNAGRLKLFALLVLCLLTALALVGLRSSVVVWEREAAEEEAPGIFSVARNKTASRAVTTEGVVVPYPTRRTAFHVRPPKNWISDPCGPLYFNGMYHIFYQYNRDGAFWGNMSWGHSVSSDLIHWKFLGCNLEPSEWYDIHGAWSGSITMINGVPTVLYTGWTNEWEQLQAIAYPENLTDPFLKKWTKYPGNPILRAPPGIPRDTFRDPSAGFKGGDGEWRTLIGSRVNGNDGVALMFKSADFIHWEYMKPLFLKPNTGMWECIEVFPIAIYGQPGLNESVTGPDVIFLFKASLEDHRHDFYGLGRYDTYGDAFLPDNPDNPIPYRYNHGKFFASKSFFDPVGERRIVWGFVNESDPEVNDIAKGWNTILGIPRTIWVDGATNRTIVTLPIDEVKELRHSTVYKKAIRLAPGAVEIVKGAVGDQLDIEVVFNKPDLSNEIEGKEQTFGPFGLLVLADLEHLEQSALYFYISYRKDEGWTTEFVSDPKRSTLAENIDTSSYSAEVLVLSSEDFLSARILVDRTVIESFVQGGRVSMNTRSYPTIAYGYNAYVFLFNNGTTPITLHSLEVSQMKAAGDGEPE
ncbi:hypothetical protein BDL97_18G008100 [Sphagnum fallax]|nr:hypothetical protein BDL97_18G008100 [Sphagnum fallax]